MVQTDRDILLQMTDVTKLFPGVVALNKMRLTVRRGTVHALMGENGAGKSTLMKILSGLYKRDGGEIIFDGEPFNPSNIQEVLSRGISMIYQELNPVEAMTVAENIFCGREPGKAKGLYLDHRTMNCRAKELLEALDITAIDPKDKVQFLSVAQKQLLEMAKAFSNNSKLIILDEPTRGIDAGARTDVYNIIKGLSKKGLAVLLISSDMEEIIELSDRAVTIHQGRLNCEFDRADINQENLTKASFGVIGKEKES